MTEEGVPTGFPAGGPAVPKAGWYRNRNTGQLRYWNGVAWTDLAGAITPFIFEPEQIIAPLSPPPPVARATSTNKRSKLIAAAAGVVVVLAIVGAVGTTNQKAVQRSTYDTTPSTISPLETTTTAPLATTTTAPPAATPTAPLTTGTTIPAVASTSQTPRVAIIGDSISEFATPALTHVLRHDTLYIDAVGGTTIADHQSTIEQVESDGLPRDWVIELGTNDALGGNTNWSSDFANEVAALQGQRCVVFLTVKPTLGSIGAGINEAIANAVATHPNFHLIDWGNIEFRRAKWLQSDALHPSKSGDIELATLVHQAILGCQGQ